MLKRMLLMLLLVALFIGGLVFLTMRNIQKGKAMGKMFAPPPTAVTTVTVQPQTWQPVLSAVGSLKAVQGVMVTTDLPGIISEIGFESGTQVTKGTVLVRLDTQQEDAQLRSSEAKLNLAKIDLDRKRNLVATKAIAQADWDTVQSQMAQMQAEMEEMRALGARKRLTAPFDGLLGIRQVNIGEYLSAGVPVVALQSLDPIYVEFSLPQQHYDALGVGKKLRVSATGVSGDRFEGEITAIDSQVNEATRNVMVQGTLKNAEHKLKPGMFVDVEVLLPEKEGVFAIPSSSIAYAPYGDSVYIVKDGQTPEGKPGKEVQQKFVKLGPKRGDQVSIISGLNAGDEIVSAGVFRLRPGAPVQVNNDVQPGNELNPNPPNT